MVDKCGPCARLLTPLGDDTRAVPVTGISQRVGAPSMATRDLQPLETLTTYVGRMSAGQAICRARSRHRFPSDEVQPGVPIPSGISTLRQHDGSYQVIEYCQDCSTERIWTTLPRGYYDKDVIYKYKYPDDWVRIPRDVEFTPRDIKGERMKQVHDMLFTTKRRKT